MKIAIHNLCFNYVVIGEGKPLILIHGNQEDHTIFDETMKQLKDTYKVYAIDSRCHGLSDDSNHLTYEIMCQDIIAFIEKLKLDKPIIYGYSDGGIIALKVAIARADLLDSIIISGANLHPYGFKFKTYCEIWLHYINTHSKYDALMLKQKPITKKELRSISIPVHILVGEKDVIKMSHTITMAKQIKHSTLDVIKNESHGSYIVHSKKLYEIIKQYLSYF